MTAAAMVALIRRLPCCAPGAPDGCAGDVEIGDRPVPLCASHMAALAALTGPWRSRSAADAWLAGMAEVIRARVILSDQAATLYIEDGGTLPPEKRTPWVDWDAVKSGKAAPPNTDWTGHAIRENAPITIGKRKPIEKPGEKPQNRWATMPWWLRKKLKAKAAT